MDPLATNANGAPDTDTDSSNGSAPGHQFEGSAFVMIGATLTSSGTPTTGAPAGDEAAEGGAGVSETRSDPEPEPEPELEPELERPAFMRLPFNVDHFHEQLFRVDVAQLLATAPPTRQMAPALMEAAGGCGIDLISYSRITTPVVARDGHIYDQSIFEKWRDATRSNYEVISPWTKKPMDTTFTPLQDLPSPGRRTIPRVSPVPTVSGAVTTMLGDIYEAIDPLSGLMHELKVAPPCVFVFGNQNAGKSTLLERLVGLPLFPAKDGLTTKAAILVKLRRGPPAIPTMRVVHSDTMLPVAREAEVTVAAEMVAGEIQAAMDRLAEGQEGSVALDKMIVVTFQSPHVPNIDLLDTPGVESNGPRKEPTLALVNKHIERHKNSAIFLAVFPMTHEPAACNSIDLIAKHELFDRTIGIITRSDRAETNAKLQAFPGRINELLCGYFESFGRDLGGRYVYTMSEPCYGHTHPHHYERLEHLGQQEATFFYTNDKATGLHLEEMLGPDNCGVPNLITRLTAIVHDDMTRSWLPNATRAVQKAILCAANEFKDVGLPPAHDLAYTTDAAALQALRQAAIEARGACISRAKLQLAGDISDTLRAWLRATCPADALHMTVSIDAVQSRIQALIDDELMRHLADLHGRLSNRISDTLHTALAEDVSPFKFGRFPGISADLDTVLKTLVAGELEQVRRKTQEIVNALVDLPNSFIKLATCSDSADGFLRIQITLDRKALAITLLTYYSATATNLMETLYRAPELLTVINNAPPAQWLEDCAVRRATLIKRLEYLTNARNAIIRVWGVGQVEVDDTLLVAELEAEPVHGLEQLD